MTYYSRKLTMPFQAAVAKVTKSLEEHGFGIITSIDVQDTFKKKLGLDFRNYKILGACNPQFAFKAISLESHIGVMLPCNVLIQEHENGEVEVTATSPLDNIGSTFNTTELKNLAVEVGNRLRSAVDDLHRDHPEEHEEALPPEGNNVSSPMQG